MEYLSNFSRLLKELRESRGLKQAELAEKLGVSRGSISFYENGDRVPDIEFLGKTSEFFDVSCDYLLGFDQNPSKDVEDQAITEATGLSGLSVSILRQANGHGKLASILNILIEEEFATAAQFGDTLEKYPSSFTKHRATVLKDIDKEMKFIAEREAKYWPEQPGIDREEQIREVAKDQLIGKWALKYYQPILTHLYNYLVGWKKAWVDNSSKSLFITEDGEITDENPLIKYLGDRSRFLKEEVPFCISFSQDEMIEYATLLRIQDSARQLKMRRANEAKEEPK